MENIGVYSSHRPTVMVTNDDGVDALGLRVLVRVLVSTNRFNVLVCAPDSEKSAISLDFKFLWLNDRGSVRCADLPFQLLVKCGTPADCASLGISKALFSSVPGWQFNLGLLHAYILNSTHKSRERRYNLLLNAATAADAVGFDPVPHQTLLLLQPDQTRRSLCVVVFQCCERRKRAPRALTRRFCRLPVGPLLCISLSGHRPPTTLLERRRRLCLP
nr:5'-nucleotidase surE [Ipomoea batatas]